MSGRLAILACLAILCTAHEGPPYPIIVDEPTGPVLLSVWTDPDVGTGTYHVYLEPLDGKSLPEACGVQIAVHPVTNRLPTVSYDAEPFRMNSSRYHFLGEVKFDAAEDWLTRISVRCGNEEGAAERVVAVTPPGQGPVLDFVLYLMPFVAVGFLIVRALVARRRAPA